jgi:C-methyltransferase C-terminal domain
VTKSVQEMLSAENEAGLNTDLPYFEFADRVRQNKQALNSLLRDIKVRGKRVAGYGAPAKATTLLYVFEIGKDTLEYIVDDDRRFKQGRFMPGSHIPIVEPTRLVQDIPDYCLILAWNFAEPIMKNHADFLQQGGKFIIPVPTPEVIQNEPSSLH